MSTLQDTYLPSNDSLTAQVIWDLVSSINIISYHSANHIQKCIFNWEKYVHVRFMYPAVQYSLILFCSYDIFYKNETLIR